MQKWRARQSSRDFCIHFHVSPELRYRARTDCGSQTPSCELYEPWKKMIVATKCFVLWEKMEPKLREVYLTSSKIRLFELHLFVAKCQRHFALTTKISNNKFLPVKYIIWPHFALLKQSHSISEVLLSWLLSGLSCIF